MLDILQISKEEYKLIKMAVLNRRKTLDHSNLSITPHFLLRKGQPTLKNILKQHRALPLEVSGWFNIPPPNTLFHLVL